MDKKESKELPKISMLVYGKAGSGKSILASTFPKPLIIDADGGHKVYESSGVFKDAKYVRGNLCLAALQKAIKQIKEGNNEFETLVIDSLTALENKAVSQFKGLNSDNWDTNLYTNRGHKLNYDSWGAISGSTIALLSELRDYPVNVVIITQVSNQSDSGKEKYYPELVGKGQNESLHFADIVAYMEKIEDTNGIARLLHLSSTENDAFQAKARSVQGYLKPIKNPTYKKLIAIVGNPVLNLDFND